MIEFPKDYFQEEERCGFTVSRLMKCTWAAQLEVLMKISEICVRHNLHYYAYFGTLLGAVRHKGYIPWDDDLDIAMKRDDYIQFLMYAKEELPKGYCILNPYTENEWVDSFTRVTNSHNIDISEERLEAFHGCPFVVGVDIFPLDYVPRDDKIRALQSNMIQLAKNSFFLLLDLVRNNENVRDQGSREEQKSELARNLRKLEEFTGIRRDEAFSLLNWILRMYDAICMMCNEKNADRLGSFQIHLKSEYIVDVDKEDLGESRDMCFETICIKTPFKPIKVLSRSFRNYRQPQISSNHCYPFYRQQLLMLKERHLWDQDELNHELDIKLPENIDNYSHTVVAMPDQWKNMVGTARRKGQKIVLFATSLLDLNIKKYEYLSILERTLRDAELKKENIFLWWRPDKVEKSIYCYKCPDVLKKYGQLREFFIEHKLGIIDETREVERAIMETDEFYGDLTVEYKRCIDIGKRSRLQLDEKL